MNTLECTTSGVTVACLVLMCVTGRSVTSPATMPPYIIVDVTHGSNAATYPVTYSYDMPILEDKIKSSFICLKLIGTGFFPLVRIEPFNNGIVSQSCDLVSVKDAYYIGVFEITQGQYMNVMGYNPSCFQDGILGRLRPVESISWSMMHGGTWDADRGIMGEPDRYAFLGRLRGRTDLPFDLPSIIQWEYACGLQRTNMFYSWSVNKRAALATNASFVVESRARSTEACLFTNCHTVVGSYSSNEYGIYDMFGNVIEFTSSILHDPVSSNSTYHVLAGGSYDTGLTRCPWGFRNAYLLLHGQYPPEVGFRVCVSYTNLLSRMEPSESLACSRLTCEDQVLYKKEKPLVTLRCARNLGCAATEIATAQMVSVQRTDYQGERGWRLVLVGPDHLVVCHVCDSSKVTVLQTSRSLGDALASATPYRQDASLTNTPLLTLMGLTLVTGRFLCLTHGIVANPPEVVTNYCLTFCTPSTTNTVRSGNDGTFALTLSAGRYTFDWSWRPHDVFVVPNVAVTNADIVVNEVFTD